MRATTQEAKDDRRRQLMAAALEEFFEKGFTAARMDDVAKRAGVSKGAVYLYFDSKDALFNALIQEQAAPVADRLKEAARAALDPEDAIRAMMRFAPVMIRETPVPKIVKVLIADAPVFPETVTAYREDVVERALAVVATILESGRVSGVFDIQDAALTARLVVAPIVISAIWRIVFEHDAAAEVDLEELFALHERMLMRALKTKDGGPR
ncbi:MAG: TetR/AcrR family transcriptional regulator [Pseudomonadota bacterium]